MAVGRIYKSSHPDPLKQEHRSEEKDIIMQVLGIIKGKLI